MLRMERMKSLVFNKFEVSIRQLSRDFEYVVKYVYMEVRGEVGIEYRIFGVINICNLFSYVIGLIV